MTRTRRTGRFGRPRGELGQLLGGLAVGAAQRDDDVGLRATAVRRTSSAGSMSSWMYPVTSACLPFCRVTPVHSF